MNIALLNGSPKTGENSMSHFLCKRIAARIGEKASCTIIHTRKGLLGNDPHSAYAQMAQADALVVVFPLYYFCVPALLDQFLADYAAFVKQNGIAAAQKVYSVVNCGFPEANINEEAARVLASFARAIGANYRFGVLLGGGGMLAENVPPAKIALAKAEAAFDGIFADLSGEKHTTGVFEIEIPFPRRLYFMMGNFGWNYMGRKNGLKRKDLKRKPYLAGR